MIFFLQELTVCVMCQKRICKTYFLNSHVTLPCRIKVALNLVGKLIWLKCSIVCVSSSNSNISSSENLRTAREFPLMFEAKSALDFRFYPFLSICIYTMRSQV